MHEARKRDLQGAPRCDDTNGGCSKGLEPQRFLTTPPEGPSTQYLRFLVPQNHALNGIWDQRAKILGTWTLKDRRKKMSLRLFGGPASSAKKSSVPFRL